MGGITKINDICHLQVCGTSQLMKEINETKGIVNKQLDMDALHRNEQTKEVEDVTVALDAEIKPADLKNKKIKKTESIIVENEFKRGHTLDDVNLGSPEKLHRADSIDVSVISKEHSVAPKVVIKEPINYGRLKIQEVIDAHMDLR